MTKSLNTPAAANGGCHRDAGEPTRAGAAATPPQERTESREYAADPTTSAVCAAAGPSSAPSREAGDVVCRRDTAEPALGPAANPPQRRSADPSAPLPFQPACGGDVRPPPQRGSCGAPQTAPRRLSPPSAGEDGSLGDRHGLDRHLEGRRGRLPGEDGPLGGRHGLDRRLESQRGRLPGKDGPLGRRHWLARVAAGGAALAAWGAWPGARLAVGAPASTAAPADSGRLVVVLLRGALDGLAAVPVPGDPAWAALRPQAAADDARFGAPLPLRGGGPFALHPQLRQLHGWYQAGELLVVHAVASPYRERSHFDAQQVVESGGNRPFEFDTGWLGRGLAQADRSGLALGAVLPLALRGAAGASSWAPSRDARVDDGDGDGDWTARVARLYEGDASLAAAFAKARVQHLPTAQGLPAASGMPAAGAAAAPAADVGAAGFVALAGHAGRFLAGDDAAAPSLAWLESAGWDTHAQQAERLARGLEVLDQGLAALRRSLGPRWATTTVLVMTEFGRSAALNGSGGTDHGTAGVAFVAGGAVAGGRVVADWPGLAAARLHEGRDLRPTIDLRSVLKPVLQRHLGLSTAQLDRTVLPGAPHGLPDLWRS